MGIFFIKDSIIYDTTDGCSKQYTCASLLWILSVLSFTYIMAMYSWIIAPRKCISKIYGTNGS